jgi:hypothetical protein
MKLLSACALFAAVLPGLAPAATVVNPISQFPITVDGQFTNNLEWSDVNKLAFISTNNSLTAVAPTNPAANSFLWAAIAPGSESQGDELYLMYDYLARTSSVFAPGEFVGDIHFPITINGVSTPVTVQVRAGGLNATVVGPSFTFVVKRDSDGAVIQNTGIAGMVGFGASPETATSHLLIELEIPLLIQPCQGCKIPPSNGVYSPAPAFWSSSLTNNTVDPMASFALFTINPNTGTLTANSDAPEPATFALAGLGLLGLGLIARRKR